MHAALDHPRTRFQNVIADEPQFDAAVTVRIAIPNPRRRVRDEELAGDVLDTLVDDLRLEADARLIVAGCPLDNFPPPTHIEILAVQSILQRSNSGHRP